MVGKEDIAAPWVEETMGDRMRRCLVTLWLHRFITDEEKAVIRERIKATYPESEAESKTKSAKAKDMKTKYKIRVGQELFDAGTLVELVKADDPRVQAVFPGVAAHGQAENVAVVFPGRDHVTILHKSQLEWLK